MKVFSNVLLAATFAASILSCKSVNNDHVKTGTITRDCTGTYIKVAENEDFLVCNEIMLKNKKEGEKVSVTFDDTTNCPERAAEIRCMMYHENKGMIRVKSVL